MNFSLFAGSFLWCRKTFRTTSFVGSSLQACHAECHSPGRGFVKGYYIPRPGSPVLFVSVVSFGTAAITLLGLNLDQIFLGPFGAAERTCIQRTIPIDSHSSHKLPGSNGSRIKRPASTSSRTPDTSCSSAFPILKFTWL